MNDRNISVGCVTAYVLWTACAVLLVLGWVVGDPRLAQAGLATSAASATATVRQFFVAQYRMMRNTFELGREARVRSLR